MAVSAPERHPAQPLRAERCKCEYGASPARRSRRGKILPFHGFSYSTRILDMLQTTFPITSIEEVAREFGEALETDGLHRALAVLNRTSPYRFTGVYCFEPGWVRSLVLFDRKNPHLQVGADVPMKESYCMFTARSEESLVIVNAPEEARWAGHAARESVLAYTAVLLLDPSGEPLGTLCHFDFSARDLPPQTLDLLTLVRRSVQEYLWAHGVVAHPDTTFA